MAAQHYIECMGNHVRLKLPEGRRLQYTAWMATPQERQGLIAYGWQHGMNLTGVIRLAIDRFLVAESRSP